MQKNSKVTWSALEQWSPTLFLIGGAGVVTHAALMGIEAFTTLPTPPDVFVTTGHLIALIGLLGLYPRLVNRTPRLTRLAGIVGIGATAGWSVMTLGKFGVLVGVWESLNSAFPGVFFIILLGSSILTYCLFGLASLRSGLGSRTVGLLVLAPGVFMTVLLVDSALTGLSALDGFLIGGGIAISMLTLGFKLRTLPERNDTSPPTGVVVG